MTNPSLRGIPRITAATAVLLTFATTPVSADQCPKMIHDLYAAAGKRFDQGAHDARKKAADAARLHREGCHGLSQRIANEGRRLLGLDLEEVTTVPGTPSPGRPCF
jgi:hypothetical protein